MYWLAIPAIIGVGIWLFSSEEKKAKKNWEKHRKEVERSLDEHRKNIKNNISKAQSSYDFHFLVDLHFSSFKVADSAYKLLEDVRIIIDGINRMLLDTKKRKEKLNRNIRKNKDDIKVNNELRTGLFDERDTIILQSKSMESKLKELNIQTRSLKFIIRDRCGNEGLDWFNRLEERKRNRN